MPSIKKVTAASAAALALTLQTADIAGAAQADIHVAFAGDGLAPCCTALATAVQSAAPDRTVMVVDPMDVSRAAFLAIQFITDRQTPQVLGGHLTWTDAVGKPATGPVIDLSVIDGPMNDELLSGYATQLVSLSDLPLSR